jgi:hypothetical protein
MFLISVSAFKEIHFEVSLILSLMHIVIPKNLVTSLNNLKLVSSFMLLSNISSLGNKLQHHFLFKNLYLNMLCISFCITIFIFELLQNSFTHMN